MKNSSDPGQRISNIVLLLTVIGSVFILIIFHSSRSFIYVAIILYLVMGVTNVYSGIMKLGIATRDGQPAVWHKQNTLLLGFGFLLLGLAFLIEFVIGDKLPNSLRNPVEIAAIVILGIPFLFFTFRSIKSSTRNIK